MYEIIGVDKELKVVFSVVRDGCCMFDEYIDFLKEVKSDCDAGITYFIRRTDCG